MSTFISANNKKTLFLLDVSINLDYDAAMTLSEYLKTSGRSQQQLADFLGITQARVCQMANGGKITPEMAKKIYIVTGKKVTLSEMRPDIWPPRTGRVTTA